MSFVALRIIVFVAQDILTKPDASNESIWRVMGLVFIFHGVFFVWQSVGVLRSAHDFYDAGGQRHVIWGAKLILGFSAFWVFAYSIEAWQMTRDNDNPLPTAQAERAARAVKYSLAVDGNAVVLRGSIELGVTDRLRDLLESYPDVTEIYLTSQGGHIYEARGIATVIQQAGLSTVAVQNCSSACTTVFIAGRSRLLAGGAKLGFHQYRIDADYAVLGADTARAQDRDRAFFQAAGVADWFLDQMYQTAADGMWYPNVTELIAAGVVTETP